MAMAIGDGDMGDFMTGDFGGPDMIDNDPVSRLRQMISDRQPETLQVLQDWIEEPTQPERAL
jgi:flagellar M-ring protein FliF